MIAAGGRSASARSTASRSFHGDDRRCRRACAAVTPGLDGDALRGEARAGVGEQAVDVAVVGAGELEDRVAAGRGARQADRAHRRLGARRGHPHHLGAGTRSTTSAASSTSRRRGRAVARARARPPRDRRDDVRVRVPGDQRAPRADVVDVAVAVDVDQLGALAALDEDRVAADRAHRPHRRVDAARQQLERPLRRARGASERPRLRVLRFPLSCTRR